MFAGSPLPTCHGDCCLKGHHNSCFVGKGTVDWSYIDKEITLGQTGLLEGMTGQCCQLLLKA
jgi:hypothetical protein